MISSASQKSIDNFDAASTSESDLSCPSNVSDTEKEKENPEDHSIPYYKWAGGQDNKSNSFSVRKSAKALNCSIE